LKPTPKALPEPTDANYKAPSTNPWSDFSKQEVKDWQDQWLKPLIYPDEKTTAPNKSDTGFTEAEIEAWRKEWLAPIIYPETNVEILDESVKQVKILKDIKEAVKEPPKVEMPGFDTVEYLNNLQKNSKGTFPEFRKNHLGDGAKAKPFDLLGSMNKSASTEIGKALSTGIASKGLVASNIEAAEESYVERLLSFVNGLGRSVASHTSDALSTIGDMYNDFISFVPRFFKSLGRIIAKQSDVASGLNWLQSTDRGKLVRQIVGIPDDKGGAQVPFGPHKQEVDRPFMHDIINAFDNKDQVVATLAIGATLTAILGAMLLIPTVIFSSMAPMRGFLLKAAAVSGVGLTGTMLAKNVDEGTLVNALVKGIRTTLDIGRSIKEAIFGSGAFGPISTYLETADSMGDKLIAVVKGIAEFTLKLAALAFLFSSDNRKAAGGALVDVITSPTAMGKSVGKQLELSYLNKQVKDATKTFDRSTAVVALNTKRLSEQAQVQKLVNDLPISRLSTANDAQRAVAPIQKELLSLNKTIKEGAAFSQRQVTNATSQVAMLGPQIQQLSATRDTLRKSISDASTQFKDGLKNSLASAGGFLGGYAGFTAGSEFARQSDLPEHQKIAVTIGAGILGQLTGATAVSAFTLLFGAVLGAVFTPIGAIITAALIAGWLFFKEPETWNTLKFIVTDEIPKAIKEGLDLGAKALTDYLKKEFPWLMGDSPDVEPTTPGQHAASAAMGIGATAVSIAQGDFEQAERMGKQVGVHVEKAILGTMGLEKPLLVEMLPDGGRDFKLLPDATAARMEKGFLDWSMSVGKSITNFFDTTKNILLQRGEQQDGEAEPYPYTAFSGGGKVRGPGTGTSDSINAKVSNGEFVVKAAAAKDNMQLLEAINNGVSPAIVAAMQQDVATKAGLVGYQLKYVDAVAARTDPASKTLNVPAITPENGYGEYYVSLHEIGHIHSDNAFLETVRSDILPLRMQLEEHSARALKRYREVGEPYLRSNEYKEANAIGSALNQQYMARFANYQDMFDSRFLFEAQASKWAFENAAIKSPAGEATLAIAARSYLARSMLNDHDALTRARGLIDIADDAKINNSSGALTFQDLTGKFSTTNFDLLKGFAKFDKSKMIAPAVDIAESQTGRRDDLETTLNYFMTNKARGIPGFSTGGSVFGLGSATSDSIPAMLSNGEFVVNAKAAAQFRPFLEALNGGVPGFNLGGFIKKYKPQAERISTSLGIDSDLLLKQLYYESQGGTSNVAKLNNNFGGITYTEGNPNGSKGSPRPASEGGNYVKYATIDDFFKDFERVMSSKRYDGARGRKDLGEYATAVQKGGYATDANYSKNMVSVISKAEGAIVGQSVATADQTVETEKSTSVLADFKAAMMKGVEGINAWIKANTGVDISKMIRDMVAGNPTGIEKIGDFEGVAKYINASGALANPVTIADVTKLVQAGQLTTVGKALDEIALNTKSLGATNLSEISRAKLVNNISGQQGAVAEIFKNLTPEVKKEMDYKGALGDFFPGKQLADISAAVPKTAYAKILDMMETYERYAELEKTGSTQGVRVNASLAKDAAGEFLKQYTEVFSNEVTLLSMMSSSFEGRNMAKPFSQAFFKEVETSMSAFAKRKITFKGMIEQWADSLSSKIIDSFFSSMATKFAGGIVDKIVNDVIIGGVSDLGSKTGNFLSGKGFSLDGKSAAKSGDAAKDANQEQKGIFGWFNEKLSNIFSTDNTAKANLAAAGNTATATVLADAGVNTKTLLETANSETAATLATSDSSLSTTLTNAWDGLSSVLEQGWDFLKTTLTSAFNGISGLFSGKEGGAGGLFSGISDMFSDFDVSSVFDFIPSLFASGGRVVGPGNGTSDSIPAMLSNGEFVVNAASTKRFRNMLMAINDGNFHGFAEGGMVSDGVVVPGPAAFSDTARGNQQIVNIKITGDISRQTRKEIISMLPQITTGVNMNNRENGHRN
jgi:hypothetical protein